MDESPRYAKAHSQFVADEYLRLGWRLVREFRFTSADEPYEYFFKWESDDPPNCIDWDELRKKMGGKE